MVDTQIHKSNRNRPTGDQAWSDREWNDPGHVRGSEAFQGRGVLPHEIARLSLEALRENRFYVFNGDFWPAMLRHTYEARSTASNPHVVTRGQDPRPKQMVGSANA